MSSRWANAEADAREDARRKAEKEAKKRLKKAASAAAAQAEATLGDDSLESRPLKRKRDQPSDDAPAPSNPAKQADSERTLLRFPSSSWAPCRHSSNFEILNPIEEGSYGFVSRARDIATSSIVALKRIKLDAHPTDGFPITALREISILQRARHANIVELKEVLAGGSGANEDVILVMEFVEHDLKTLQEDMVEPFMASEVKTLMRQLVGAVGFLHDNAILHRDLKTSNILLSHAGQIKIADFGMARVKPPEGVGASPLTQLVVTLWYRAPELLLGVEKYSTEIDMWSVGCIFGELLNKSPILQGKNEVDELALIFNLCGLPTDKSWPAFWRLPNAKGLKVPRDAGPKSTSQIRRRFPSTTNAGVDLLSCLLSLNPERRLSASEVLAHPYIKEAPRPKPTELFPTFPSKANQEKRRRRTSPNAPKRGGAPGLQNVDLRGIFANRDEEASGAGFQLKMN